MRDRDTLIEQSSYRFLQLNSATLQLNSSRLQLSSSLLQLNSSRLQLNSSLLQLNSSRLQLNSSVLQLNSSPLQLNSSVTRMAEGANTKTWFSSCYKNLFKYNSSKQLFIRSFTESYVSNKVKMWSEEILSLSNIAETHPHSAYSAFTHSIKYRWNYVMRTIKSVGAFFQPLEDAIHQHFLPALTGWMPSSEVERELLSLPCRFGGLNITNPTCCSDSQFSSSRLLSASLVAMIQQQTENFHIPCLQQARSTILQSRQQIMTSSLANIKSRVDPPLQRTIELISVKCSSLWLTALPLQEQRFHLNLEMHCVWGMAGN